METDVYQIFTIGNHEFNYPSDYQIKQIFGVGCEIETDGDDTKIYVNRKRDSFPIGELTCTSHKSLSPVKALDKSVEIH